ncbi:hypothetical protein TRAPUB_6305 [Trametes pubescens]|uniref:BTB domain-containing protein n=1 Tax=Trametes pubescens TaxID=154538 RepID=A0A1M2V6E3_TRAPU|nr:hypothetical protein TRAPUB_6305 [Trametes pubescens]
MTVNPPLPGPRVSDAAHPFDKPSADIILRSSDLVDFRVYSQILIAASPFFEGLFLVPQPPDEEQPRNYGLPIIEVSEDSETLDYLLRLCYPVKKPQVVALEVIEPILRAAMKYEMELADTLLTKILVDNLAYQYPLEVWAIGCRLRREDIASVGGERLARTYATPGGNRSFLHSLERSISDLEGVTAGQLFRVFHYTGCSLEGIGTPDFRFIDPPPTANVVGYLEEDFPSTSPLHTFADISSVDVSCRSSDGVVFHAHQAVLGAASSVLRTKVAQLATGAIGESGELESQRSRPSNLESPLPVLQFEETSQVLPHLLSCCYPGLIPSSLSNLPQLVTLISAAARHDIALARPALLIQWSKVASTNPLRAYFIAIQAGDTTCAKEAARHVLRGPITGVYMCEMESSPALAYQRLLSYYQSCKDLAQRDLMGKISLHLESTSPTPFDKTGPLGRKNLKGRRPASPPAGNRCVEEPWIQTYTKNLWTSLEHQPDPSLLPTVEQLFIASTSGDNRPWCRSCRDVASALIERSDEFKALRDAMEKVIFTGGEEDIKE